MIKRIDGNGRLVLIGGGEFSFGETREADLRWLELAPPGAVGFLPTASGSMDYGQHFADYIGELSGREVVVIPVFRRRDASRGKNAERIKRVDTIYIGGGVTDHLLDTLAGSPALEALTEKLVEGGMVVGIAAAAQAAGQMARSLLRREVFPGFGWLPDGALEPNFELHQKRRLGQLMDAPGVSWGLGLPASTALVLGPNQETEAVGTIYRVSDTDSDPVEL